MSLYFNASKAVGIKDNVGIHTLRPLNLGDDTL